ncbi:CgeB family protein [Nitrospira lenta]|uniref:Spore protein YkvP/CgeB glycosyl transferase-like domain-containing protein n=1 Tax=Nitrospira lenta TaxID=1436998 RepID=A0A330L6W2_9BACT|nr:glycosyltransferase [Nitrospira lenta]SPP65637.1 hypothetical protein NITLEN_40110 [Nitrospira lenta]
MTTSAGNNVLIIASLTPTCTAHYFIRAFRQLGCVVNVCSDVPDESADLRVHGTVDVPRVIAQLGVAPEYVLFIEGGTMQVLPMGLERVPCVTAWYGIDTHMDYSKHLRIGRLFDVTFVAQKEYVERLRADGLRQIHWLPLGFAAELLPSPLPERTIDIAYVGSDRVAANQERHALLGALRREFSSTHFGTATPEEMGRIYASARVVFNKSVKNDVNMRFFEAAGAGAVLVTDEIVDNGVEDLFEEGTHYVSYQDEASLIRATRDLLADPRRCTAIGERARQHVLEHHTYRHRAAYIKGVLSGSSKAVSPQPEDYFAACLSLGLLGAALGAVAQAMAVSSASMYRASMGAFVSPILRGLATLVCFVERVRAYWTTRRRVISIFPAVRR